MPVAADTLHANATVHNLNDKHLGQPLARSATA